NEDLATFPMAFAVPGRAPVGTIVRIENGTPAEFKLERPCRIGSGSDNDVVVAHRTVSRSHVELAPRASGVDVQDLGSTNGTFYLGQRIGTMTLATGARIQVGAITVSLDPDAETLLAELDYAQNEYRGVLGASLRMRKLFALLQRLESSRATVLVEGESG